MSHSIHRLGRFAVGVAALLLGTAATAVTAVNPFGVNVRSQGPTTIFLTFQNLDPGEAAVEAFWCGELQPAVAATNPTLQLPFAVQAADPCVPTSVYGRLPVRLDRSRPSTSGTFANLTDIMSIPASVARRAYQDAQAGLNSAFFYVRRFSGPAGDRYVIVTCRMAGGGARVAFALLNVQMRFEGERGTASIVALRRDEPLPPFGATIQYNGSGTLKGRWEVVMPGDPEPADEDLLTEATLPVERRPLQRRYTLVDRFEVFLPPTGELRLPGPDLQRLPRSVDGAYKILLRVEASDDKEGDSNTGAGRIAHAGGVAGFPMPVLRYFVGSGEDARRLALDSASVRLFAPAPDAAASPAAPIEFAWVEAEPAALARLEVERDGQRVFGAVVRGGTGRYVAPPFFGRDRADQTVRWRVVLLDAEGRERAHSGWQVLQVMPARP
jgi:hypothetical protein